MKFETKWPENTPINWWNENRKELNKIIDQYNNWQLDGMPENQKDNLLRLIELGKQTIGSQDGGSGYNDKLIEMQEFVESQ